MYGKPDVDDSGGGDATVQLQQLQNILSDPVFGEFIERTKKFGASVAGVTPEPSEPGFCYLATVRSDARAVFFGTLHQNPHLLSVQSWLQTNPSVWSSARFQFTYGCDPGWSDGRGFVQAHIQEDPRGLTVKELLHLHAVGVRLGADTTQHALLNQAPGPGASVRAAIAPVGATTITVPFSAILFPGTETATLCPRDDEDVTKYTGAYESAVLVDFNCSFSITGGSGVTVAVGVGTGHNPRRIHGYVSLPHCVVFSGSDQGNGTGEYRLPPTHSFGTEVKAPPLGNQDPTFFWMVESPDPYNVIIRGSLTLRLSGVGVLRPFRLATGTTGTAPPATDRDEPGSDGE